MAYINHVLLGTLHEVLVELEGMGGGGKIQLEVCFLDKSRNARVKECAY